MAGHSLIFWEGEDVAISEYIVHFIRGKKKHLYISVYQYIKGTQLDVVCTEVFWFILWSDTKFYMLSLSEEGEVSLSWIQNQILRDLLEFSNKHLQTLLIQYSMWHIWIKPTLPSCFPTRLGSKCYGSKIALEKSQQRADISANLKGHIKWPRKCHSSKCKSRDLQVRVNFLASGQHIGTIGHPCSSYRGNTLEAVQLGRKDW